MTIKCDESSTGTSRALLFIAKKKFAVFLSLGAKFLHEQALHERLSKGIITEPI